MLLGPATTMAATPNLIPSFTVVPTEVSNGDYVAFRASIYNNDTSTVSQLFLVELGRTNLTLVPGSLQVSQGTCDTSGALFKCTLGQLKPHKTATVVAIYTASLTAALGSAPMEFN